MLPATTWYVELVLVVRYWYSGIIFLAFRLPWFVAWRLRPNIIMQKTKLGWLRFARDLHTPWVHKTHFGAHSRLLSVQTAQRPKIRRTATSNPTILRNTKGFCQNPRFVPDFNNIAHFSKTKRRYRYVRPCSYLFSFVSAMASTSNVSDHHTLEQRQ